MKIINKENLKKYALNYLGKYASSKKNLEIILHRRIIKNTKYTNMNIDRCKLYIQEIIGELEQSDILNDAIFANSKAFHYIRMGKSKKMIELNLLKKGINKIIIQKTLKKLENDIPNLEYESANNFAKKRKLGRFGSNKEMKKDLEKMGRAGFNYNISLKVLGYK